LTNGNGNTSTRKFAGNVILLAALGTTIVSIGYDVKELHSVTEVITPGFIGNFMIRIGTLLSAYAAGRITPDSREGKFTRAEDTKLRTNIDRMVT